jgi:hypothetical protein
MEIRAKTETVKKEFLERISYSYKLFKRIEYFTEDGFDAMHYNNISPNEARQVISLTFLNIVSAWDDYLEGLFLRYMVGAETTTKYKPELRLGKCNNLQHAIDVLSGKNNSKLASSYINWSNWAIVEDKAKIFFVDGKPFTNISSEYKQRLTDAYIIRNRIAHSSQKSKIQFSKIAKHFLGLEPLNKLPKGYTVGKLLLVSSNRGFRSILKTDRNDFTADFEADNIYECFIQMFFNLINILAPSVEQVFEIRDMF